MLEKLPEADLARRCRKGDAHAWRELVRRFTPLVYRLSLRMLRTGAEAEDASQEVFLRMHRSFSTFDATRPMTPWVARTAYHVCLRRLQSASSRALGDGQDLDGDEPLSVADAQSTSPELAAEAAEAHSLLTSALFDLPAQDRALLDLRYREGLSDSEVAEATGMPVNTVKTRIFRARGRLRRFLAPLFGEET
ncbi:MAG: RNA polymerase sigma factor [Myxococcales bacterium]